MSHRLETINAAPNSVILAIANSPAGKLPVAALLQPITVVPAKLPSIPALPRKAIPPAVACPFKSSEHKAVNTLLAADVNANVHVMLKSSTIRWSVVQAAKYIAAAPIRVEHALCQRRSPIRSEQAPSAIFIVNDSSGGKTDSAPIDINPVVPASLSTVGNHTITVDAGASSSFKKIRMPKPKHSRACSRNSHFQPARPAAPARRVMIQADNGPLMIPAILGAQENNASVRPILEGGSQRLK